MDEFDVLEGKLTDESKRIQVELAWQSAKSYDEYRYICGMVNGLAIALGYIEDLRKANEKGEDDG